MQDADLFLRFGVSLIIGFLIGLQREFASEKSETELALGIRTFTLLGFLGCGAAFISDLLNSVWPFVSIVFILGIFLAVNFYVEASQSHAGLTTEVSALITVIIGAAAYWQYLAFAIAMGVTVTVLLSTKIQLHRFVERITRTDVFATLKFAVITAIVLPILPNQNFGPPPFTIFNPFKIWLLVVFISGISFVGYILIKIIGARKGIGVTGFLGGLASSTAVTLSFTQRSKTNSELSKSFALAIVVAWTVMFARVIIEVSVVNPKLLPVVWIPMAAAIGVGLIYSVFLYRLQQPDHEKEELTFSNPFELGPAIQFGLLFAIILFVSKLAQEYLGDTGLYLSSIASGLADVDAITLSVAELSKQGPDAVELNVAARAIVLAAVSNTFLKGGFVIAMGGKRLRKVIWPGYLLMMAVGVILVLLI